MKADGLSRALRYFVRQAELYVLGIFGGSFVFMVYQWLIMADDTSISDMIGMLPNILLYLSLIVILTIGVSVTQTYYPMLISFGCRRRNVFLGNLFLHLMLMVQSLILYKIFAEIFGDGESTFGMPMLIAIYLITSGISQLIGIVKMKWGKIATVLLVIVFMGAGMGAGFILAFSGTDDFFVKFNWSAVSWTLVLTGVCICAAVNAVSWRVLCRYEVKA